MLEPILRHNRFFSSSLLLIYEGGEGGGSGRGVRIDVRLIDFARTARLKDIVAANAATNAATAAAKAADAASAADVTTGAAPPVDDVDSLDSLEEDGMLVGLQMLTSLLRHLLDTNDHTLAATASTPSAGTDAAAAATDNALT